jgi:hypothetical protein
MEAFGGVPQFLVAFGYGPEGSESAGSAWIDNAMRLCGIERSWAEQVVIEYRDLSDRTGPLLRTRLPVSLLPVYLTTGAASLNVKHETRADHATMTVHVPFTDLAAVYKEVNWVVRVTGSLDFANSGLRYVAFGSSEIDTPGRSNTVRSYIYWSEAMGAYGMPEVYASYRVFLVADRPFPGSNTYIVLPLSNDAKVEGSHPFPGTIDDGWQKISEMLDVAHPGLKKRIC